MAEPTTKKTITIGSRGSQLALTQSEEIKKRLEEICPAYEFKIEVIQTKGDKILDVALSKIGDKGLFTKELDIALLNGSIDLAVHSLKDIPTHLPEGMVIGAISKRHIANDCAVIAPKHHDKRLEALPPGSVIGSSSLRRVSQLKRTYPHLQFKDVRGNLNTRLAKLDKGDEYDALILAVAGLSRLGFSDRIHEVLPVTTCMHAVGQGALATVCRANDTEMKGVLNLIHCEVTRSCCEAERSFLREMEGGCQVPVGVYDEIKGEELTLHGVVLSLDGTQRVSSHVTGPMRDAVELGKQLADQVKAGGGDKILQEVFEAVRQGLKVKDED